MELSQKEQTYRSADIVKPEISPCDCRFTKGRLDLDIQNDGRGLDLERLWLDHVSGKGAGELIFCGDF